MIVSILSAWPCIINGMSKMALPMCSNFSHLFLTVQVVCVAKNLTLFEFIARRNKHTTLYVMYVPTYVVICMVEKDGDPFQATSRPRQEGRRWQKSAKTRARASTVVAPRCSCSCKNARECILQCRNALAGSRANLGRIRPG